MRPTVGNRLRARWHRSPRRAPRNRSVSIVVALLAVMLAARILPPVSAGGIPEPAMAPGELVALRATGERVATFVAPPELPGGPRIAAAQFAVDYNGFSPEAQAAFGRAIEIWSALLGSPVEIRVRVYWTPLAEGVLGQAGATYRLRDFAGAPQAGTWYPAALANKLAGSDLDTGQDDIVAYFNSDFAASWYFGTGVTPAGQLNFVSVALHELGHGLGFSGTMSVDSGVGRWGSGGSPASYDRYAVDGAGTPLLATDLYPNPSAALAGVLQGGDVRFAGPAAVAAAGGTRPKLYAPSPWWGGSSFSHLDEATYPAGDPNSLMTPGLAAGETVYSPGPIALGILRDLGWDGVIAPGNDHFPGVPLGALPTHRALDTSDASFQTAEPTPGCATSPIGKTIWYSFTPSAAATVALATAGSAFDTALAVYTGDELGDLVPVPGACDDNDGASAQARVAFTAQAGTTYRVQVGGVAGAGGALVLDAAVQVPVSPPVASLTVIADGAGVVQSVPDGQAGSAGTSRYPIGQVVALTPQPTSGQVFTGWMVDGVAHGWAVPLALTMDADHTVRATFVTATTFPDVPDGRVDTVAVAALATRGYIRGYSPRQFAPDFGVTRAEMAALIARATPAGPGIPPATLAPPACIGGSWDCEDWGNPFGDRGDLDGGLWRDIGALAQHGVAFGYAGGRFGPNDPVTYAQTISFITRAMIAKGYWVAQPGAPVPAAGVPGPHVVDVATFQFYAQGRGGIPAPPADWNAGATRGWFAHALWAALDSYWGLDDTLPDGRPAGGLVP